MKIPEKIVVPGDQIMVENSGLIIRVQSMPAGGGRRWVRRIIMGLLIVSVALNVWLIADPLGSTKPRVAEFHHSGEKHADDRIAIINFKGIISPPFTERWLKQIEQAAEDESVRGVVLVIDSPGGFVADSHQLHRRIQQLAAKKPVYAAMQRIAASGGYYIAMGIGQDGRIFAEPTTWTGSIGVIIPRYNVSELAGKIGVRAEPLITGPYKDSLNPFRELSEDESGVWNAILSDSFDRFVSVIEECRSDLDDAAVRRLATGQIYTARQAVDSHLVDEIGYLDDVLTALAAKLQLDEYEAFEYRSSPGLIDVLMGVRATSEHSITDQILGAGVPAAMYFASWNPWVSPSVTSAMLPEDR